MSFLHNVRLTFTGQFQADVSTVNNDVRHYDNATFEPVFQEFATRSGDNGWWNPPGSGAFRLVGCRIVGVSYADGSSATDDPCSGLILAGSDDRTSGKLVDIDPQWQLASAIWGMTVRLTDGTTDFFQGAYRPHSFRDLWFGRMLNAQGAPGSGDGLPPRHSSRCSKTSGGTTSSAAVVRWLNSDKRAPKQAPFRYV